MNFCVTSVLADIQTPEVQGQVAPLQQTFSSPGILGRRLATQTSRHVWRSQGTVRSTCKVTTCTRFPGQLDYDLCKPAVNLSPVPSVYATRSTSSSPQIHALTHQIRQERITSLWWPKQARFCHCQCTFEDNRSQLRSCRVGDFLCRPRRAQSHVQFIVYQMQHGLVIHMSLPCSTSALRTYRYDNKHPLQYVSHHTECEKFKLHL